jgi:dolichol-phosphate mannosyltransferase
LGVLVHLAVLGALVNIMMVPFILSQGAATLVAMTQNFFINNIFTYRDRRLKGRQIIWGLGSFFIACSIGGVINLLVATALFEYGSPWWLSGFLGAVSGAVWNFATTSTVTWGKASQDK